MARTVSIECTWCQKSVAVLTKEFNRRSRAGKSNFFCNNSCGSHWSNMIAGRTKPPVAKVCPHCSKSFTTRAGVKGATFCSHSCAATASVTPYRRLRAREMGLRNCNKHLGTLENIAKVLRSREAWKYTKLAKFLTFQKEAHVFEEAVGSHIRDLVFPVRRLIVEFDGDEHAESRTASKDVVRDDEAIKLGWAVTRIGVDAHQVIDPAVLYQVLSEHQA